MTRETKLGLVVAGSFLALVGGVVTVRLRQADGPPPVAEVAAAQPAEAPVLAASDPEKLVANPVTNDALAMAGTNKMPSAITVPDMTPPPAPVPSAPPTFSEPKPVVPIVAPQIVPPPASAPAPAPEPEKPAPVLTDVKPPPPAEPEKAPAPIASFPDSKPAPEPEKPVAAPTDVKPPEPEKPAPVVAPAPLPEPPAPPAPAAPTVPLNPPMTEPVAQPKRAVDMMPDPPAPVPSPLNPSVTNPTGPNVTVIPASAGSPSGASLEAPRGAAVPPQRDPFAATPKPMAPPEPRRDSYLEEQHRWRPGDNFAAISTQYYSTDKYATALQKYNRDYPLATREMRQNPPALAPGQVVWVPPPRILERDYAGDIGGLTPVTPATPTSRPTVEPVAPPPGLANSGFGNAAGKMYRVRQPGESLQEIARRTLGDSGQALRVRGFNPTLSADPRLPIPPGTVLKLPNEARVEAADQP
jgi:hypothetical protein